MILGSPFGLCGSESFRFRDFGYRGELYHSIDGAENWFPFDTNGLGNFGFGEISVVRGKQSTLFLSTERGVFSYTPTGSKSAATPLIKQLSSLAQPPGATITITGENFGTVQAGSSVRLGSEQINNQFF